MISKYQIHLREHGQEEERGEQHQIDGTLRAGGPAGHHRERSHDGRPQEQDYLGAAGIVRPMLAIADP